MGAIKTAGDYAWRDHVTPGVASSGANPVDKRDVRAFVATLDTTIEGLTDGQETGALYFETWTLLNANPGDSAGQSARVYGDAGTHTDPVVGGTVSNSGVFRWSESPAGWKRIADLDAIGKQDADAQLSALAALSPSANDVPYFSGASAMALQASTSYGRGLLNSASASALKAALSLVTADISGLDAALAALQGEIDAAEVAIAAEASTRATAITAEQVARAAAIASEASTRGAADTAEAATRAAADSDEAATRAAADSAEATTRAVADIAEAAARTAAIAAETTARNAAIAAEALARDAAVDEVAADLAVEIAARIAAITAEQTTRAVLDGKVGDLRSHGRENPGDTRRQFTQSLDGGDPNALAELAADKVNLAVNGYAATLTGPGVVATRRLWRIEPGRLYRVRGTVARRTDTADPANDAIRLNLACYSNTRARLSSPNDTAIVVTNTTLTVAGGRVAMTGLVALSSGGGATVLPAACRYVRPYAETFGSALTQSDVDVLDIVDVTDAVNFSPDLSAFTGDLQYLMSLDLDDRVEALEGDAATPTLRRYPTRTDALAETDLPLTVTMVEVMGYTVPGDCPRILAVEVGSEPATADKMQIDGRWFQFANRGYHHSQFNNDRNAAVLAAFKRRVPLFLDSGTATLNVYLTTDAEEDTGESRWAYWRDILSWRGTCRLGNDAHLILFSAENGLHLQTVWDSEGTGVPVPYWDDSAGTLEIRSSITTGTIASITIGARGESDWDATPPIVRGEHDYPIEIVAGEDLPEYARVPGYSIGLRNTRGDNDGDIIVGAFLPIEVSGARTLRGTWRCNRIADLVSPTTMSTDAGDALYGMAASQLIIPTSCIGYESKRTATGSPVAITAVQSFGQATISGMTNANPAVITAVGHGFLDGQTVTHSLIARIPELDGLTAIVRNPTADTYEIEDEEGNRYDSTTWTAYTAGAGVVRRPVRIEVGADHGITVGSLLYIDGMGGATRFNDRWYRAAAIGASTIGLLDLDSLGVNDTGYGTYTSGGTVQRYVEAWTGGADEAWLNLWRGGRADIRNIGISFPGLSGGSFHQDTILLRDPGTYAAINGGVVLAGAGDMCIRVFAAANAFINQACIGGPNTYAILAQGHGSWTGVRSCVGGSRRTPVNVGDGSFGSPGSMVIAGGFASNGGRMSATVCKLIGAVRAIYPFDAVIYVGPRTIIELNSTGLDGIGEGLIIGNPTFGTGPRANTTDSFLVPNSVGTATASRGGARWIRDYVQAQTRPVHSGGTGASTAPAARVNLNIDQRSTVSNAASTIAATSRYVAQIGSMSAARTWTLPAAAAVNAGQIITLADESGTVTDAFRITVQRAGSDTVDGGTSIVLAAPYASAVLISDGVSKWTRLMAGRVVRRAVSNAAATIVASDQQIAQTGTMSASRAWTLPAANAVPAGTEILILDESGTVTATNTIVITRAGSDTIDGATTLPLTTPYAVARLVSDGASKWTAITIKPLLTIDTTAAIASTVVPAGLLAIETRGRAAIGDGGDAAWMRVGSEPSHAGKKQSANGVWFALCSPVVTVAQIGDETVQNDRNSAATIAYAIGRPLWVNGEALETFLDVSLTAGAAGATAEDRHAYLMALCDWHGRCRVGNNHNLVIRITENGLHTVKAWAALGNSVPIIRRRGKAAPTLHLRGNSFTTHTISSITIGTRGQSDFTLNPPVIRGPNDYPCTIVVTSAIASYARVRGYAIGLQNVTGDNDAECLSGAFITETVSVDGLTLTGTITSWRTADLVAPSSIDTTTTLFGVQPSRLIVPYACIAYDSSYTAGASATVTGITRGATTTIACSGGHSFTAGQYVKFSGVGGTTQLNNQMLIVAAPVTGTDFNLNTLDGVALNSAAYSAFTSGGTAQQQTQVWTGGDYEGYFELLDGASMETRSLGVSFVGYPGSSQDHDTVYARDVGSRANISTGTVMAGAGSRILRGYSLAHIDVNQAFLGNGGAQYAMGLQAASHGTVVRSWIGGARQYLATVTDASHLNVSLSALCAASAAVSGQDSAVVTFLSAKAAGHLTGLLMVKGSVCQVDSTTLVNRNTIGLTRTAGGGVDRGVFHGTPTFSNNAQDTNFSSDPLFTAITASGTHTLKSWARRIRIIIQGAGGGGGSGAAGDNSASRFGGGGGGAGGYGEQEYLVSELAGTVLTATVGAGGTAGASVTGATGNPGGTGGTTSVAISGTTIFSVSGGSPGGGGTTTAGSAGSGGVGVPGSSNSGGASSVTAAGAAGANFTHTQAAAGGGAGGGVDTSGNARDGGVGGAGYRIGAFAGYQSVAGTAGTAGGAGGAGGAKAWNRGSGAGGGGGAASTSADGGSGGAGGAPGGGAGGGAGCRNGSNSGAGGVGGRGEIWVIEYAE